MPPIKTPVAVAILDDYQNVALQMADWSRLEGKAKITVFNDHVAEAEALVERLKPFDVLCVMRERTRLPGAIIERLPNLKLIASTAPINAAVDVAAATARGIFVSGTGYTPASTIEHTWALILALARHIPSEASAVRHGHWQVSLGEDLGGQTLGVLGLGRIGSRVAKIGRAFDMEVIAWSQNLTQERAEAEGTRLVSKEELFRQADFLTIHLILSRRTRGLVGARELALMKPSSGLINTSRGEITDEAALIAALNERRIAGAALDVFAVEPLPEGHPFRTLDNVIATPHTGYVSRRQYETFYGDTVENILAWLDGKPIRPTPDARAGSAGPGSRQ
jgi:phosphoglycerate dehydrogenase-like enzyme